MFALHGPLINWFSQGEHVGIPHRSVMNIKILKWPDSGSPHSYPLSWECGFYVGDERKFPLGIPSFLQFGSLTKLGEQKGTCPKPATWECCLCHRHVLYKNWLRMLAFTLHSTRYALSQRNIQSHEPKLSSLCGFHLLSEWSWFLVCRKCESSWIVPISRRFINKSYAYQICDQHS
jgi:hypothetical protein